jgi:competence protein ComEC
LLTNMIVGFWIEWLVIIGFFSSAIGILAPIITDWINFSCLGMMQLLTGLVNTVAQWPGMVLSLGKPSIGVVMAIYALIAKLATQRTPLRLTRYHGVCCLALIVGLWLPSLWLTQPFRIIFLDVGQGDSCIIQTPNRHTIVVDTGPPGSGRYVLGPALRRLGVTAIDLVILTHWHRDHVGGFNTLKRQFTIGTVLQRQGANTHYKFDDGTQIDIIYPNNTSTNINNQSITTRVRYGPYQFLLTGDLEQLGERELIAEHSQHLTATVLKLGHHGSKTSSIPEFLDAVAPQIGIVSAGRNNRYRHPHPQTLEACQWRAIKLYRTDHHGAIAFQTDGTSLYSRTWLPERH